MKFSTILAVFTTLSYHGVQGFAGVNSSFCLQKRTAKNHKITWSGRTTKTNTKGLFGILDDMDAESSSSGTSSVAEVDLEQQHEDLFHNLIFAPDTRKVIVSQLETCTDPNFLQYLTTTMEQSGEEEEQQAVQELLDLISDVQTSLASAAEEKQAKQEEKLAAKIKVAEESETEEESTLSDADVLKQASAIDRACGTAAPGDDEKPSDFMSDCREVVNLSGGFNNNGQMRVGGS